MSEMEKESFDSKLASGSVPMLGPDSVDLDFKSWINAMKALVNSLSGDFNLLTDPAPDVPLGVLEIAGIAHATVRRVEEARREMYVDWKKAQKACVCTSLDFRVSKQERKKSFGDTESGGGGAAPTAGRREFADCAAAGPFEKSLYSS